MASRSAGRFGFFWRIVCHHNPNWPALPFEGRLKCFKSDSFYFAQMRIYSDNVFNPQSIWAEILSSSDPLHVLPNYIYAIKELKSSLFANVHSGDGESLNYKDVITRINYVINVTWLNQHLPFLFFLRAISPDQLIKYLSNSSYRTLLTRMNTYAF